MELWIRSQDKEKLFLIKELYVFANEPMENKTYKIVNNCNENLGIYKTKERALEVLNEIQKKIKATYLMKAKNDLVDPKYYEPAKTYHSIENDIEIVCGDNFFDLVPINADVIVYEMPEV